MIKIENITVYGWEAAIRGMRNPMNSWDKSDSIPYDRVGEEDLKLMKSLVKAGPDHAKFMRMVDVTMDITAPMYWWKEFDTYKVGTVRNSCSTMHKLTERPFKRKDFSCEHLYGDGIIPDHVDENPYDMLGCVINCLNYVRDEYLEICEKIKLGVDAPAEDLKAIAKRYWYNMIQLLPSSYNQRATIHLNYAVLRNMYHSRKNHKLDEWREFCKWIETLPYSELITMEGNA